MKNKTMNKGDVHVVLAQSREHPVTKELNADGKVFGCVGRGVIFDDWAADQSSDICNCSMVAPPSKTGYFDLITDPVAKFGRPTPGRDVLLGVFIPNSVNKLRVANELRERFGAGSVLLKATRDSFQPSSVA